MQRGLVNCARRLALMVSVACGVLSITPVGANAFAVIGARWDWDYNGNNCGQYGQGSWRECIEHYYTTSAFNGHSGWQNVLNNAASWWNLYDHSRNQADFAYVNSSQTIPSNLGVQVDAADLGGRNSNGIILLGQTYWTYYVKTFALQYIAITMSTNSQINWNTNTCCTTSSQYFLEEAIIHELGHGLGLNHPVNGPNAYAVMQCIMWVGENDYVKTDDSNGESWLYSSHPGDFGSPGSVPC